MEIDEWRIDDQRNATCGEALVEDRSDAMFERGRVRSLRHRHGSAEGLGMQSLMLNLGLKAGVRTWTESNGPKQERPERAWGKRGTWS